MTQHNLCTKTWWADKRKRQSGLVCTDNLLNNNKVIQFCSPQLAPSNIKVMRSMQKEKKREKIIRSLKRGHKKFHTFENLFVNKSREFT